MKKLRNLKLTSASMYYIAFTCDISAWNSLWRPFINLVLNTICAAIVIIDMYLNGSNNLLRPLDCDAVPNFKYLGSDNFKFFVERQSLLKDYFAERPKLNITCFTVHRAIINKTTNFMHFC